MKKLGVICLLAIVLASPSLASAQTVTQEEVNAQLQVLLNQLLVQVQELMAKLVAMQAKQVEDSVKLGAIESTVRILNPNVGAVSQPVEVPVQFTAIKGTQTLSRCIPKENYSGNDGVNLVLGSLTFTPKPTKTAYNVILKAHTSTPNLSQGSGNKPLVSSLYQGNFLTQGRTDIQSESSDSITEPSFWLKEIKNELKTQLIIDSMIVDGVEVQGLPITFEPIEVTHCQ